MSANIELQKFDARNRTTSQRTKITEDMVDPDFTTAQLIKQNAGLIAL